MTHIAEVIAIGDELITGQRVDTNTAWISERLGELGLTVTYHSTVADQLAAGRDVFRRAVQRADLVISTGGLGPTADDLTREMLAEAAGVDLVHHEQVWQQIQALFARRGRPTPERNIVQARFPEGGRPIHNPQGTAPGIDFAMPRDDGGRCQVYALPGVPAELFEMWHGTLSPALSQQFVGGGRILHRRLKCFGVGESQLEAQLPDLIRRGRDPSVGITVHEGTITLRISGRDLAAIEQVERVIRDTLGTLVFGAEDDELPDAIARLMEGLPGKTLAVVEWATAGLVAQWLGGCPALSPSWRGGVVVTDQRTAEAMLDLQLAPQDSSEAWTSQLAEGLRQMLQVDLALAVGPPPNATESSELVPQLDLALAVANQVRSERVGFAAHSAIVRPLAAKRALDLLRRQL